MKSVSIKAKERNNLDLICAGKLYLDIIFTGLARFPILGEEVLPNNVTVSLGGGAAICAVGSSSLGLRTGIIGVVADNLFGNYIVQILKAHNVNTNFINMVSGVENNISVSINVSDDRSMVAYAALDDFSEFDNIKKNVILSSKHLHVKGLSIERANLLKFAKKNELTTSLDINLQTSNQAHLLRKTLPYIDIFLPSAWEVSQLFENSPRKMAIELGKLTRQYCIIKLGREGSIASEGNNIIKQASNPVKVIDATGAGDAYNAGFLWAFLTNHTIEQCLKAGTIAAELCLQTAGGIGWVELINGFYDLVT